MITRLPPLLLLATATAVAASDAPAPANPILRSGTNLDNVVYPNYDEHDRLSHYLRAKRLTFLEGNQMQGNDLTIHFVNPDESPRGTIHFDQATFTYQEGEDAQPNLIQTTSPVALHTPQMHAQGSGLLYEISAGKGFLTGPIHTWVVMPVKKVKETSMNSRTKPLRVAAALSMATLTISTAEPEATTAPPAPSAALREDLEASAAATAEALKFLEKSGFVTSADGDTQVKIPAALPLDVEPGPNDTVIDCDGGLYFDPKEGVIVFLKNVRVSHPEFGLTAANDLKIFLSKEPAPENAPEKQDGPVTAKFGDIERIVATGAVHLTQKKAKNGKEAIEASAAICTYNLKNKTVTMTGGKPWVRQGGKILRAKEANQSLSINTTDNKVTFDQKTWQVILPTKDLR